MPNKTSERLSSNLKKIMNVWEQRALIEIKAAHHQETLALRNSLPEYLTQLVDALSSTIDRTSLRKMYDKNESTRVGKKHGHERAIAHAYTMDQMIAEYHILRQVICDVLEEDIPLTALEREVIVSSVEQAVNDAATQFSDTLKDLQEKISNTLAHDLRNPLTTAKFSTQMILRDPSDVKGIIVKSNRISLSLDRIDKMITALLDASRLKAGEYLPLEFKELSFDWLAREVAYELNINYNDRFSVESHGSCIGSWNEDGLRRLLENLCTNAIKYGNQNSPIKISLEEDATSLTFNVHNDGEPIPKEEQANLFEKFKRARTSENKIGWGLGLSVVKSMVDAHRGSVSLESHPDSGTVFKIKIPKDPATFSCESDSADCLENHL